MSTLVLQGITKVYPGGDVAVDHLDMTVEDGELFVLVGPSGCGKTSVLRMIAGLEEPTSGEIVLDGIRIDQLTSQQRDLAMVFQQGALYPHLTVAQNIGFSLAVSGVDRHTIATRVARVSALLHVEHLLDLKPRRLSGGQAQRVAMGRAIIRDPKLFLMDEPMSNLDAQLRTEARAEVLAIQRRLGTTTVYVTHDQVEAMALGDRIAVLRRGRIVQCGTPMELYDRPVDLFVARFIGSPPMSILRATVVGRPDGLALRLGRTDLPLGDAALARHPRLRTMVGRDIGVGLRAEAVRRDDGGPIVAGVAFTESLGAEQLVHATVDAPGVAPAITGVEAGDAAHGSVLTFVGAHDEVSRWRPLRLAIDIEAAHLFDLDTGLAIPPMK